MQDNNTGGNNTKRNYFQEDVRYYVREDGQFIPVYSRARRKVEPPIEKVKEAPFSVENYEIFKYDNENLNSSDEPFTDEDWSTDDNEDNGEINENLEDEDDYDFGYIGLEEKKIKPRNEHSSCNETDADDEYDNSSEETSDEESYWTAFGSEETSSGSKKDPEEIKEIESEDLKPFMDEILKPTNRPFPKKWKPNPYMSTLVYRDKITESDKEEMQYQKEINKIKLDDLIMPTEEEVKNFVIPKVGDENYMGELAADPDVPDIPLDVQEKEVYKNTFDDVNEVEEWPKRDYQSDFVTDTTEFYSTLTEVSDSDLEPMPSDGPQYPDQKPEEYMEPEQLDLGEHQYEKMPLNQPQVRTWYDWHGDQYRDVRNREGEWETVEKVYEEYPLPKPKHSEHFWKKKGEEQGYFPKKCSPYDYPPDEDGYYHHCPGYNHIPGSENWSFYDDVEGENVDGYDSKTEEDGDKKEDDGKEENKDKEVEDQEFEITEEKDKEELRKWQDYVTQCLRAKPDSNKEVDGNLITTKNDFEESKMNDEINEPTSAKNKEPKTEKSKENFTHSSQIGGEEGKHNIDCYKVNKSLNSLNRTLTETNDKKIKIKEENLVGRVDVVNCDIHSDDDDDDDNRKNPVVSKKINSPKSFSGGLKPESRIQNEMPSNINTSNIYENVLKSTLSNRQENLTKDNVPLAHDYRDENIINIGRNLIGLNVIHYMEDNTSSSKVKYTDFNDMRYNEVPFLQIVSPQVSPTDIKKSKTLFI